MCLDQLILKPDQGNILNLKAQPRGRSMHDMLSFLWHLTELKDLQCLPWINSTQQYGTIDIKTAMNPLGWKKKSLPDLWLTGSFNESKFIANKHSVRKSTLGPSFIRDHLMRLIQDNIALAKYVYDKNSRGYFHDRVIIF